LFEPRLGVGAGLEFGLLGLGQLLAGLALRKGLPLGQLFEGRLLLELLLEDAAGLALNLAGTGPRFHALEQVGQSFLDLFLVPARIRQGLARPRGVGPFRRLAALPRRLLQQLAGTFPLLRLFPARLAGLLRQPRLLPGVRRTGSVRLGLFRPFRTGLHGLLRGAGLALGVVGARPLPFFRGLPFGSVLLLQ
jgi:hypothetical protein